MKINLGDIFSSPVTSFILSRALGAESANVLGLIDDYAAIKAVQGSGQSADAITQQVAAVAADAVGQIAGALHVDANLQRNPGAAPTQAEGVNEILLLGAKQIAAEYAGQAVAAQLAANASRGGSTTQAAEALLSSSSSPAVDAGRQAGSGAGEVSGQA